MALPMHYRQTIQRIPAYLPMEPQESSFSPSGSCRTLSVESKSASTSSGYGTPCAVHGEGYYRHTSMPCSSTSFGYLTKNDSNLGCDIVLEESKLKSAIAYRKRSQDALKQRSGDMCYQRMHDNLSPPSRLERQGKLSADHARIYDANAEPQNQQSRQYRAVYRFSQQHPSQYKRSSCSFYRDHCHQNYNCYVQRNSSYFSSSSSSTNNYWRENDDDYSLYRVVQSPPHIYPAPSKWKSESDLREYSRFNVDVKTLDEEATEIYNELVTTANMLALTEQNPRMFEARRMGVGMESPPVPQRRKSFCDLRTMVPAEECNEKITPRLFPKPLDKRRQRRVDRQCTPTNMAPLGAPRNSRLSYHLENSMDAIVPDRDEASALAALEAVVNVDFLKSTPGRFTNGSGESGPTRIIRTYLGEPEDTWVEQKARYANGNISPGNHSCIEIDGDDDDTEKLEPGTLPPDTMVAGTLGEGSGSYSEFTNSGDMSCPSDLEI